MNSKQIRKKFLDFFQSKSHQIVSSAPIVLKDDSTLMFTNSGMNQFKDIFLGHGEVKYSRIADSQKCLRVSGKHNDLDDVGKDTYHHTMFEMLGNWSFGDYFKEEAINWAWELLTQEYKLDPKNMYATVFIGDEGDKLGKDLEAYKLWQKHLPDDRILDGDKKDNFWEMGETGPCGPCSEIHLDLRSDEEKAKISGRDLVNQDHPLVIEVWNLVFMQYLRKADKTLEELPNKHIDTGMGFERLCMAMQNKTSNYDTDVFTPLIKKVEEISGKKYGEKEEIDIAIRVVVDHCRAIAFAIADGQLPSNTGAGYVIRRILRRATSYAYRFLDIKEAFIYQLVTILSDEMGEFFPEITKQKSTISVIIKEEENSFISTIEGGLHRMKNLVDEQIQASKSKILPGDKIFELYDTYGFPLDLSSIIANENGLTIDEEGFYLELEKQKTRSKSDGNLVFGDWVVLNNESTQFKGYTEIQTISKITKYREIEVKGKKQYQLVLDQTPFYPEGGGQIGDTGELIFEDESIKIISTKKENNLPVHNVLKLPKNVEATFLAKVDKQTRLRTTKNHSATHVLHFVLREVLGKHVEQKGSFVGPDYLRFDFSHFSKMTEEELKSCEDKVNQFIMSGFSLYEQLDVPFQEALAKGATALFGEKYSSNVRMIQFGDSIELCAGTHVGNTSEIGLFILLSESAVATGIRRIEAITGETALAYYQEKNNTLKEVGKSLRNPADILKSLDQLILDKTNLEKTIEGFENERKEKLAIDLSKEFNPHTTFDFLVKKVNLSSKEIKSLIHQLRKEKTNRVVVLGSQEDEKAMLYCAISDEILKEISFDAKEIINCIANEIDGRGGGQNFFASAGGKKVMGLESALVLATKFLENK